MKELNFDIGQWVACSLGYGQIIYIRAYYIEDYENHRQGRKNGEFIMYMYIIKILCGFDGRIKKSNRIINSTSIEPIDKQGKEFVEKIKKELKDEYNKYILYDEKNSLNYQLFLEYKLDKLDFDIDKIEDKFYEFVNQLNPSFTYKEFSKLFKEYDFPFKLENLNGYALSDRLEGPKVQLRFDSKLYKTKDKEAIFDNVRIFFPKSLEK